MTEPPSVRGKAGEFQQRVREARLWHGRKFPQHDLVGVLRSASWRPAVLTPYAVRSYPAHEATHAYREREVLRICESRRSAVALAGDTLEMSIPPIDEGQLLAYRIDDNLADGAAAVASGGFFDVNNEPPWDLWVDYDRRESVLVSWVPPEYIKAATDGIAVNPEICISWLD